MRYNPPPNWPAPPTRDWKPPPGWQPDPAWGPPPPGWQLWVDDNVFPEHVTPRDQRPWYKKKRFIIPAAVLAFFVVVGIFAPDPEPETTAVVPQETTSPEAAKPASTVTSAAPATTAPQPVATRAPARSQQQQFIGLIEDAKTKAEDADNDFQRRLPLTSRDKAICKLLKSKTIEDWTGEVKELNTNGDGLGVLAIEIADGVAVSTWNNALSDFQDNTLIQTDSPLFATMGTLNEGDQVTFSGKFASDPESCISEQSITDNGSTQTPTFTMKFSKVAKS
jgi:hypothetical protein